MYLGDLRALTRNSILLIFFVSAGVATAQNSPGDEVDYKDRESHERFGKRRFAVSAWQINQLKEGALVVKLNTSRLLIDAFNKRGLPEEAERVRLQQAAANINIIRAYISKYKFSKVYFIYSHSTDSLLKGTRSGIFVDYDLNIDPAVIMKEPFYLIAERDYVYNSSIGFVPEESAASTTEKGNPSSSESDIVVKNKYGHQLKNPFPFATSKVIFSKRARVIEMFIEGKKVPFTVTSSTSSGGSPLSAYKINGKLMELNIPRHYTYEVMAEVVEKFNASLNKFYRESPRISEDSRAYKDSRPFFY
jgi:hypothetical protein